ncbi:MAG: hypothetical protein ACLUJG_16265 [Lawsonibacter sp.]
MVTRIVVSVVLAPLFFVILFFLPPVYLAVLMAAICALASYELLRATGVAPHNGLYGFTAAAAAAIPLGQWLGRGPWWQGSPLCSWWSHCFTSPSGCTMRSRPSGWRTCCSASSAG